MMMKKKKQIVSVIALLIILSSLTTHTIFGVVHDDETTGGSASSTQPANVQIDILEDTLTEITLADKGEVSSTEGVASIVPDGDDEDGFPSGAEFDGARDWVFYESQGAATDMIRCDEEETNTNAYYRVSGIAQGGLSVTSQGGTVHTISSAALQQWVFYRDGHATTGQGVTATEAWYGPRQFTIQLAASDATITEPAGISATGEGSTTLRLIKRTGGLPGTGTYSIDTVTISAVLDATSNTLYLDDDVDMTEGTDTENGLERIEDDGTAVLGDEATQGMKLEKGSEVVIRGVSYIVETDITSAGATSEITFTIGYFSGYDETTSNTSFEFMTLTAIPSTFPSGQSLSFTFTLTGAEHEHDPTEYASSAAS